MAVSELFGTVPVDGITDVKRNPGADEGSIAQGKERSMTLLYFIVCSR